MDIDNLSYLQSPLKEKVEQLLNQSSLNDDHKSVINEVLNYFTKRIQQFETKYNIKFSGDDSILVNGELISGSKKRSFSSMGQDGDAMAVDNIPITPLANKLSSFINIPNKPAFKPYLYNINYIIHDVSFQNPRRVYNLAMTQECFIIFQPNNNNGIDLVIPYGAISDIICVTVPESATKQWCVSLVIDKNYQPKIIRRPPIDLTITSNKKGNKKNSRKNVSKPPPTTDTTSSSSVTATNHEIYFFKFNDNKSLKIYESNPNHKETEENQEDQEDQEDLDEFGFKKVDPTLCNKTYLFDLFKKYIWPNNEKEILEPNPSIFVSKKKSMANHTKNKSHIFHINCYYKTKEGFLFLLNEGIFYGTKKPSLYFPMNSILSIQVTNVMSRTFNLHIRRLQYTSTNNQGPASKKLKSESDSSQQDQKQQNTEEENYEFSMIDSVEFDAIMDYIRKHKTEWSTNRNGEFGMNTEDVENSEQQNDDDNMDEDKKSNRKKGAKGKAKGNKKGEAQNIFTFVDEDESNDEDYHPDNDSDSGDSDEDSDIDLDKNQEKIDMENDKEVLKTMNEGNKDLEDDDDNTEVAKSTRSRKSRKNSTSKASPHKTKPSTTEDNGDSHSPMMEDKTEDEDEEISAISSNVEEISISSPDPSNPSNSSSTKRSKRKSSNPKKMSSSSKTKTSATTKRKSSKTSKNDNNDTSSSTNANITNTAVPSTSTQEKANKISDNNKKKQLTLNDLFGKANSNNRSKPNSPIQIQNEDDDDDDEEDEILFE